MIRFIILAAAILQLSQVATSKPADSDRPNIIVIMADDIGYGDLSCYGATQVQTPHLDALAKQGRRFTDAHSAASTCTPTRRALLTGVYSWRQKPGSAIMRGDAPLSISTGTLSLPRMLHDAGYFTGLVGKWHLGLGPEAGPDWNSDIKPGPLELGFDHAYFIPATGDRVPCVYIENHKVVGLDPADPIQVSYENKIGNEPTVPERPDLIKLKSIHGHDNTIINGIGRIGWMSGGRAARWKDDEMSDVLTSQAIRFIEERQSKPFFLYFATHNIHVPRVPHPRFRGKSQCGVRGDAIVELDDSVGRVLDTLDKLKLADKTLVIFTSDNGGTAGDGYEDEATTHPFNGKLRGKKSTVYEGGHRIPFIARWPGKIQPGSQCDELIVQVDLLRSFASLLQVGMETSAARDSRDVLPALLGQPHDKPGRTDFIVHNGGVQGPFAVRSGNWKLVQGGGGRNQAGATGNGGQLFDLGVDLSEQNDLAASQPEKVKELLGILLRERGQ